MKEEDVRLSLAEMLSNRTAYDFDIITNLKGKYCWCCKK
jgi:hypothetical protein